METDRILLRPWRESDAATLFKYASDPEVGPRAGWPPHKSVEESLEIIRTVFRTETMWAVELKETGEAIGCVGYLPAAAANLEIPSDQCEVGYWIARPYWGKGICTEAMRLVVDYCLNEKGFSVLWGTYFPSNPASGRVMEKCGFADTGRETLCPNLEIGSDRPVRVMKLEKTSNMKTEINPKETKRAYAFEMWLNAPMPMVTLVKTMNVSHLIKLSRKSGIKFNTLMCWCIGKAAVETEEMFLLPENGKLFRYNQIAVNVVVKNNKGGINSCDIPFSDDLRRFNNDYLTLTTKTAEECQSSFLDDHMVVGTSAMIQTELDCVVNQYTDKFLNPMVMWGKYRKSLFKTTFPVSFQFHHVQMDGGDAARFLERLQRTILAAEK